MRVANSRRGSQWRRRQSLTASSQLVDGEYDEVEEELKELDESHDGEAEPQTEHAACVWDELQQLTTQPPLLAYLVYLAFFWVGQHV